MEGSNYITPYLAKSRRHTRGITSSQVESFANMLGVPIVRLVQLVGVLRVLHLGADGVREDLDRRHL